jgi:hypothetical protein
VKESGFVYIYNIEQARYYILNNVKLLDTGLNKRTNKVWYKFSYNDTLQVYADWCNRIN